MYVVLGAGIAGCCTALMLSRSGQKVQLIEQRDLPMLGASLHNEGKLHLGYVYAADHTRNTVDRMQQGSLSFLEILCDLLNIDISSITMSRPFHYAVPTDSMLPTNEIIKHFRYVDESLHRNRSALLPSGLIESRAIADMGFSKDHVGAVQTTSEISLDPREIGALITGRVMSDPNIEFLAGNRLTKVERRPQRGFVLHMETAHGKELVGADRVINCLWENRITFDKQAGVEYRRSVVRRFKIAITFRGLRDTSLLDSATFIVGPYGDVVNYGNGNYFLSWYPVCRTGITTSGDTTALSDQLASLDRTKLLEESIAGMQALYPQVAILSQYMEKATVGGGYILSWGSTDIDDPQSELHQRHEIGYQHLADWYSVDTGKYCMGPYFARALVDDLLHLD